MPTWSEQHDDTQARQRTEAPTLIAVGFSGHATYRNASDYHGVWTSPETEMTQFFAKYHITRAQFVTMQRTQTHRDGDTMSEHITLVLEVPASVARAMQEAGQ